MANPTGRWGKKAKVQMKDNRTTHRVGLFQALFGHGCLEGGGGSGKFIVGVPYFATIPYKVPSGSSLACCRRLSVAATPYSPRAAASMSLYRITFCVTSGRRPRRAQARGSHTPRRAGKGLHVLAQQPATTGKHRQTSNRWLAVTGQEGCKQRSVLFTICCPSA